MKRATEFQRDSIIQPGVDRDRDLPRVWSICVNRNPVGVAIGLRGDQRDDSTLTGLRGNISWG